MIGRLWGITIRVGVVLEILKLTKESKNNYYSLVANWKRVLILHDKKFLSRKFLFPPHDAFLRIA